MPLGRYACGVQWHIVLDAVSGSQGKARFGVKPLAKTWITNFSQIVSSMLPSCEHKRRVGWTCHRDSAFCQITVVLVIVAVIIIFFGLGTPFPMEPKKWLRLNQVGMTISPVGPQHKNCRATKHHWTIARQLKCAEKETESVQTIIIIIIIIIIITVRTVATDCIVFVPVFLSVTTITHEPLHTAWWNFARTCTLTTARNPENFKVIGQKSRSQTRFSYSLPWRDRTKKFVYTIAHEPLHSVWCYFAWTCTLTTARTLLNFKVIGQRSRSGFDTVQYAILPSKLIGSTI